MAAINFCFWQYYSLVEVYLLSHYQIPNTHKHEYTSPLAYSPTANTQNHALDTHPPQNPVSPEPTLHRTQPPQNPLSPEPSLPKNPTSPESTLPRTQLFALLINRPPFASPSPQPPPQGWTDWWTNGLMDPQTDGLVRQMDRPSYRDARTHLKRKKVS